MFFEAAMWIKDSYTTNLEGDLNHQRDKISDLENQQASSKTHQNLLDWNNAYCSFMLRFSLLCFLF